MRVEAIRDLFGRSIDDRTAEFLSHLATSRRGGIEGRQRVGSSGHRATGRVRGERMPESGFESIGRCFIDEAKTAPVDGSEVASRGLDVGGGRHGAGGRGVLRAATDVVGRRGPVAHSLLEGSRWVIEQFEVEARPALVRDDGAFGPDAPRRQWIAEDVANEFVSLEGRPLRVDGRLVHPKVQAIGR